MKKSTSAHFFREANQSPIHLLTLRGSDCYEKSCETLQGCVCAWIALPLQGRLSYSTGFLRTIDVLPIPSLIYAQVTTKQTVRWSDTAHRLQNARRKVVWCPGPHLPSSPGAAFWKAEVLRACAQQEWLVTLWLDLKSGIPRVKHTPPNAINNCEITHRTGHN